MALLIRRFAPSIIMEGSSRRPNKLPLRIHHRAWGGRQLLVPQDYRRPADNGVFVASSKNLLQLQHRFAPAQERRLFCSLTDYCSNTEEVDPGHDVGGSPAAIEPGNAGKIYAMAKHKLEAALTRHSNNSNVDGHQVLRSLSILTLFARDKDYYEKEYKAKQLLKAAVVLPLSKDLHRHGRLHDVVRESLALARLLLKNAPEPVARKLRSELRPVLHKIVRDCGGGGHQKTAEELRELRELASSLLQVQD